MASGGSWFRSARTTPPPSPWPPSWDSPGSAAISMKSTATRTSWPSDDKPLRAARPALKSLIPDLDSRTWPQMGHPVPRRRRAVSGLGSSLMLEELAKMTRLSLFNSPLLLGFDHFERTLDRIAKAG